MLDKGDTNIIAWGIVLGHVYMFLLLLALFFVLNILFGVNMDVGGFEPYDDDFPHARCNSRTKLYNHRR